MVNVIIIIHIFCTFFMTGLCWFVQIVHYPLFHQIKLKEFPLYERKNLVTGYITIPIMIIEMLSGLYLIYYSQDFINLLNILFFGITGLSTFLFQVPTHLKLRVTASTTLINKLIRTNWIRTISWTIRSIIVSIILLNII